MYAVAFLLSLFLFLVYEYLASVRSLELADLVAILFTLTTAFSTMIAIRGFEINQRYYLPLMAALFAWGVADLLYYLEGNFFRGDPANSSSLLMLYILFNLLLLGSVVMYFANRIRSWHRIQLYTDLIAMSVITAMLVGNAFFMRLPMFQPFGINTVVVILSVLIDMSIFFLLIVMLANMKIASLMPSQIVYGAGLFFFLIVDATFLYQFMVGGYSRHNFVDQLYYASFIVFSFAIALEYYTNRGKSLDNERLDLQVFRSSTLLLIVVPLVLLFRLTNLISTIVLIRLIAICVIYYLVRQIVHISHRNEQFYLNEHKISRSLESSLQSRTLELVEANIELEKQASTDP